MNMGKNLADASGPLLLLQWLCTHLGLVGSYLPAIVTVIGGIMSIVWYGVRFYDRFVLSKGSVQE